MRSWRHGARRWAGNMPTFASPIIRPWRSSTDGCCHRAPAVEESHVLVRLAGVGIAVAGDRGVGRAAPGRIREKQYRGHERLGRGFPAFGIGIGEDQLLARQDRKSVV